MLALYIAYTVHPHGNNFLYTFSLIHVLFVFFVAGAIK